MPISRRRLLLSSLALAGTAATAGAQTVLPVISPLVSDEVRAIHRRTLVIDPHLDIPLDYGSGAHDPRLDGDTQFDLPKARRGGIGAVALALFVPQGPLTPAGYADASTQLQTKLKAIKGIALNNPDRAEIARTADDVRRVHRSGKLAILISLLNAYPLGEDLSEIDRLHADGVRIFGFTHAGNNAFADSSRPIAAPAEVWGGLSPLGHQAVTRLNDLGVLIDISQLTKAGALQVISSSRTAVIATHSDVKSLVDNPRNLSDEELDALAAKGGVVAINAFKSYLRTVPADSAPALQALRGQYQLPSAYAYPQDGWASLTNAQREPFLHAVNDLIPPASVTDLGAAIDYAVKRIGIDHVAISSDFNHGGGVIGWNNEGEAINVTAELVRRGYSEGDIAKLWGQNVLRVLQGAQAAATA